MTSSSQTPAPRCPIGVPFQASIDASALHKALAPCYALKSTIAMEFDIDKVTCVASSRSYGVRVSLPCTSIFSESIKVQADLLKKVLGTLRGVLSFGVDGARVSITDSIGMEVRFDVVEDDVMKWPSQTGLVVSGPVPHDFSDAFRLVATHASPDPARININVVCVEGNGERLTLVATDGHRMVVSSRTCSLKMDGSVIIPAEVAAAVPAGDVVLGITKDHVFLDSKGSHSMWAQRQHVTFPPYRQVIPSEFGRKGTPMLSVSRSEFFEAFDAFSRLGKGSRPPSYVQLSCAGGGLVLESAENHLDRPAARFVMKCTGKPPCDSPTRVNADYLRDAAKVLQDDRVRLYWSGPLDAVVISDRPKSSDGYNLVIVMPCRV